MAMKDTSYTDLLYYFRGLFLLNVNALFSIHNRGLDVVKS